MKLKTFFSGVDHPLVVATALAITLLLSTTELLWRWDFAIYDWLLPITFETEGFDDIVIVAIDEGSLAAIGQWPWPRDIHARLIDRLSKAGATAIGMDILFAEPSSPSADERLAQSVRRSGRVVLPVLAEPRRLGGPLHATLPLPELSKAAAALGHVDMEMDEDGIVRTTFTNAGMGTPRWQNFAIALDQVAQGLSKPSTPELDSASSHYQWVREHPFFVPYLGPPGFIPRLSYSEVLEGNVDESLIAGRIVIVGATAAGLGDILPTPLSGRSTPMPGSEIIANIFLGTRHEKLVTSSNLVSRILLALVVVAFPLFIYPLMNARPALLTATLALFTPVLVSAILLFAGRLWWPPISALAGSLSGAVLWGWLQAHDTLLRLTENRKSAAITLGSIGEGVIKTDATTSVTEMNATAADLLGCKVGQSIGIRLIDLLRAAEATPTTHPDRIAGMLEQQGPATIAGQIEMINSKGITRTVETTFTRVCNTEGVPLELILVMKDITENRVLESRLAYQSMHDALTGLPNRSRLLELMNAAITNASRQQKQLAVVFLNLDRIKVINDSLGYDFGDWLLVSVASALRGALRGQDTLARVGGDEFVAAISLSPASEEINTVIRDLRGAVSRPVSIDGKNFSVTACIGVSLFPEDGQTTEELLRFADAAMRQVKRQGADGLGFHSNEINKIAQRRADIERSLQSALNNGFNGLDLHYQPIVRLKDRKVTGVEALLRWTSAEFGPVLPDECISVAEESGLIVPLGEWILDTACAQAADWRQQALDPLRVSVNLSLKQFIHQDIPAVVLKALQGSGLPAHLLELEITESAMMHDVNHILIIAEELKSMGVRIALDDFGTGYSSLSYIKQFPIDRIKIDQSFVRNIGSDPENTAIVHAVLSMARSLVLGVVAEGIENADELDFMSRYECDEGQGFMLARPADALDTVQNLRLIEADKG